MQPMTKREFKQMHADGQLRLLGAAPISLDAMLHHLRNYEHDLLAISMPTARHDADGAHKTIHRDDDVIVIVDDYVREGDGAHIQHATAYLVVEGA